LVTGAGQRLGQAIALALGERQAEVVVHYHRSAAGARRTAAEIEARGGRAHLLSADLSDRAAARRLVDDSLAALGGLDLLVASAANFERIPFEALDDAALYRALDLNLAGPFALAHQAAPALRASRGNIVFITCSSATAPYKNYLPYTVSKAALRHLMRTLSLELAPDVRVNAVAPGTVLPPESYPPEAVERLAAAVPLQRIGSPDDVVRAVLYLNDSSFVTGQELIVDGGRS
jgi:pteridine reductase